MEDSVSVYALEGGVTVKLKSDNFGNVRLEIIKFDTGDTVVEVGIENYRWDRLVEFVNLKKVGI